MAATWGPPAWRDDFTGTSLSSAWGAYTSDGHQHGDRNPRQCQVRDGKLLLVSAGRATCGMAHEVDQQYGRWEALVRSTGSNWNHLFIIWPESGQWPKDGEYDWMEMEAGGNCFGGFIHYPGHTPKRQEQLPNNPVSCVGLTNWNHIAFEWGPDVMRGFVNGKLWYSFDCKAVEDLCRMPSGHLTIQSDLGQQGNALLEVDWVAGWKGASP